MICVRCVLSELCCDWLVSSATLILLSALVWDERGGLVRPAIYINSPSKPGLHYYVIYVIDLYMYITYFGCFIC